MKTKIHDLMLTALPLLLFTIVSITLLLLRLLFNMALPGWGAWGIGLLWGVMAFDYLVRAELFKQIGGFAITLIAVVILAGALLPQNHVARYPQLTSDQLIESLDAGWNAVYTGNVFKQFSVKQKLIDYGTSLRNLDPFRHGKMILFALLGMALAVVFLFPIEPTGALKRGRGRSLKHRSRDSLNVGYGKEDGVADLNESDEAGRLNDVNEGFARLNAKTLYIRRFLLLFFAGVVFAGHVELLQVLSPTRLVTFRSFFDSSMGLLIGLLLFVPVHLFYIWLAHLRTKGSRRFNVIGVGIDAVNMDDCLQLFEEIIGYGSNGVEECGSGGVAEANPHTPTPQYPLTLSSGLRTKLPAMTTAMGVAGIVESRRRQKLQRILNESVLNTPDGMPLVWLGKLFGYRNIERVYGPDLLRDACAYGEDKSWRHYFWGAAPGIVDKLKEVLEEKHPKIQISGICCPPFRPLTQEEEDALVEEVNASKTDIFWIGISTPKQLYFMDHIRDRLNCKIICPVGYAFDVNAGVEQDAPDWIKYAGLQWLHRGIKQPRLWKRYLPDNPMFILKVFAQILHLKKFPMFAHQRPVEPYTDGEGYPRFPAGAVALSAMTLESARDRVLNWVASGQRHYVNICTADTVVQCYDRPDMAKIVMNAGMATTDGMPLVWLAKQYGFKAASRVYGPDLMLELCRSTAEPQRAESREQSEDNTMHPAPCAMRAEKKCSHFFYGATDEVLDQLKTNLLKKFPDLQIAGMYSPPFRPLTDSEKEEVAQRINASGADIVWCGLGTPKQDYWVAEFRPRLECAAILAVGAAFNFHAGHVRQAPRWMMRSGLEWFFRLLVEPRRLWRRYIIGNPRFVFQTFKQVVRARSIRKHQA